MTANAAERTGDCKLRRRGRKPASDRVRGDFDPEDAVSQGGRVESQRVLAGPLPALRERSAPPRRRRTSRQLRTGDVARRRVQRVRDRRAGRRSSSALGETVSGIGGQSRPIAECETIAAADRAARRQARSASERIDVRVAARQQPGSRPRSSRPPSPFRRPGPRWEGLPGGFLTMTVQPAALESRAVKRISSPTEPGPPGRRSSAAQCATAPATRSAGCVETIARTRREPDVAVARDRAEEHGQPRP